MHQYIFSWSPVVVLLSNPTTPLSAAGGENMAYEAAVVAAAITGAGAIIAAGIAFTGVTITNIVAKRLKERELLISALQFLEGGTQKRSIGIALFKKYAEEDPDLREAISTIFLAQMLHLEDRGHAGAESDRKIEKFNYRAMRWSIDHWAEDKRLPPELEKELAEHLQRCAEKELA
jgi:hypothetical protein